MPISVSAKVFVDQQPIRVFMLTFVYNSFPLPQIVFYGMWNESGVPFSLQCLHAFTVYSVFMLSLLERVRRSLQLAVSLRFHCLQCLHAFTVYSVFMLSLSTVSSCFYCLQCLHDFTAGTSPAFPSAGRGLLVTAKGRIFFRRCNLLLTRHIFRHLYL